MEREIHVRLSWNGTGKRIHGGFVTTWKRVAGGMEYGIWSVRRQMWILQHFVPD